MVLVALRNRQKCDRGRPDQPCTQPEAQLIASQDVVCASQPDRTESAAGEVRDHEEAVDRREVARPEDPCDQEWEQHVAEICEVVRLVVRKRRFGGEDLEVDDIIGEEGVGIEFQLLSAGLMKLGEFR